MKTLKIVSRLTYPILLLAFIATGVGLFWPVPGSAHNFTTLQQEIVQVYGHGLYRNDTTLYAAQAIGQDIVTLFVGLPLLFTGLTLARKGSLRGQLLLTGVLGYMLYTYTSYSFSTAYNELFLVYVALFSLSLFAFIQALVGLDADQISQKLAGRLPRRGIAIFLSVIGGFLGLAWLGRIVPPLFAQKVPYGLEAYTTLGIQVIDLGIVVPAAIITAILLWQKRPWGYTLSSVLVVKALMMGAALIAMILGEILSGLKVSAVETVMFTGIALAAMGFSLVLFRNIPD